jgi:hypothetical protein
MLVLVACEHSGVVRDQFIAAGHDAVSADYLPTESPGPHHQGDVLEILDAGWDLIIAHPPCTYLANSGVGWLKTDMSRWDKLDEAAEFFNLFLAADCPRICVENPRPHKWATERMLRKPDQCIQPYQFGHMEQKTTCFWLKGLPLLSPTVDNTEQMKDMPASDRHRLNNLPESKDRWKLRSRTFLGIARAMVQQWGNL